MKFLIIDRNFHIRNKEGFLLILSHLGIDAVWSQVVLNDFSPFDVIYSPGIPLDVEKWPTKKFLFGPHFGIYPSVFPIINAIHNSAHNVIYLQPSDWVRDLFQPHVKMPVRSFPFPLNLSRIPERPHNECKKVLLYCKARNPVHSIVAETFLKERGFEIQKLVYGSYSLSQYFTLLQTVSFVMWVGCHESQGFALCEALATNTPVFVWNVRSLADEWKGGRPDIPATTCAYWDSSCGETFTDESELETTFDKFYQRLLKEEYNPRKFVERVLSVEACSDRLREIVGF